VEELARELNARVVFGDLQVGFRTRREIFYQKACCTITMNSYKYFELQRSSVTKQPLLLSEHRLSLVTMSTQAIEKLPIENGRSGFVLKCRGASDGCHVFRGVPSVLHG
jgi:hypothetical protein